MFAEHLRRSAAEIVYQQVEDCYRQPWPQQAMLLLFGPGPGSEGEGEMPDADRNLEQAIRERAYLIWEHEGRPADRAEDHWRRATNEALRNSDRRNDELVEDEEKILLGRADVNMPALLTRDVHGG